MAEQQSGLRFDIYERVHLQEGARSIQELDEVELVPHIQVVSQSEQAVLKGHLQLSGTYSSGEEGGRRTLEHQIPVEITLPASRVGNAQDLFVEIENFDVDVLSPRSLNVTGVLSLHGVEMVSVQDNSWRSEEETVFIHKPIESLHEPDLNVPAVPVLQAEEFNPEPRSEPFPPHSAHEAFEYPLPSPAPQQAPAPFVSPQASAAQPAYPFPPNVTPHFVQPEAVPFMPSAQVPPHANPIDVDVDVNVEETEIYAGADVVDESELKPEVLIHAEEKKDVKVALGSKKVAELAQEATYGIKSLLQKSSSIFLDKRKAAEAAAAAPAEPEPPAEPVEWKRLFLSSTADGQQFRKLRLAIVQKEETLETIAQRYQINPRELQLVNRLQDGEVTAGKVIFIPR